MTKEIPLTKGKIALVDDEDYDWLARSNWYWEPESGARARIGGKQVTMHRLIMQAPPELEVDHINRNRLDNRRSNLRLCTQNQNQFNRGPQRNGKSRFKGVSWDAKQRKWRAFIQVRQKRIRLGRFNSEIAAAKAYDAAARVLHGDFAYLNFPEN